MSSLVVWRPNGMSVRRAETLFKTRLDRECDRLSTLLGREHVLTVVVAGEVLIGRIHAHDGVRGWQPWWRAGSGGIAWQGLVEDLLADSPEPPEPAEIARVSGMLRGEDEEMADWRGRWAACAWDVDGRVDLVTGATGSPSLWWTEGPDGWAAGHRIRPLLDLTGRTPELDAASATELVAFGWLIGTGSLYSGVERLDSRRHVIIEPGTQPRITTWLDVASFLAPALEGGRVPDVALSAERLQASVRRQLQHSHDPLMLLSGGRDSRAIAAAAAAVGFRGPVASGGGPASLDAIVAGEVARVLELEPRPKTGGGPAAIAALRLERLRAWTQIDEGVATLRQALVHGRFFRDELPVPENVAPLFHGLGGEVVRAFYHPAGVPRPGDVRQRATRALLARVPAGLRLRRAPADALASVADEIDSQLQSLRPSLEQWLDIYYWQVRCLRWGSDLMVSGDALQWHWTPLLDREWILDAWSLPQAEKTTSGWIERVTTTLAPGLEGIPYAKSLTPARRLATGLARDGLDTLGRLRPSVARRVRRRPVDADTARDLQRLWQEVFLSDGEHAWPEIIARDELSSLIDSDPAGDACWSLATVELFWQGQR